VAGGGDMDRRGGGYEGGSFISSMAAQIKK
jgi:hypothetical protein